MNRYSFLCLAGAGVLAGCSSVSVSRDFDSGFDFPKLKTYAWKHEIQPRTGVPRIDDDLLDQRIRRAVDTELRAKGFVQTAQKESAGFHVEYFMDFQQRIDGSTGSVSVGMGRSSAGRAGSLGWSSGGTISDYEEAQLTIDMLNPENGRTIWRGVGRRRTSSSTNPEKITSRTEDTVRRVLSKFPPKQR